MDEYVCVVNVCRCGWLRCEIQSQTEKKQCTSIFSYQHPQRSTLNLCNFLNNSTGKSFLANFQQSIIIQTNYTHHQDHPVINPFGSLNDCDLGVGTVVMRSH